MCDIDEQARIDSPLCEGAAIRGERDVVTTAAGDVGITWGGDETLCEYLVILRAADIGGYLILWLQNFIHKVKSPAGIRRLTSRGATKLTERISYQMISIPITIHNHGRRFDSE